LNRVAVLMDGDFFLRMFSRHFKKEDFPDPVSMAKRIHRYCCSHVKMCEKHQGFSTLYRIYFYDCPPLLKTVSNPITKAQIHLSKTELAKFRIGLHDALKETPNVALRLGMLNENNAFWKVRDVKGFVEKLKSNDVDRRVSNVEFSSEDIVYYAHQKGVDMKIGVDITTLVLKKLVDTIVLVSGDSDFAPAAKLARVEGVRFILDAMHKKIRPTLAEHIDVLRSPINNINEDCYFSQSNQ